MVRLLPYMLPLGLVYFGEYLINQSIVDILVFPKSFFSGKEYIYYQVFNIYCIIHNYFSLFIKRAFLLVDHLFI